MDFSNLVVSFGKLHPAIIHFPIALLSIAAFLEVLSWMKIFQPASVSLKKASAINLMLGVLFGIPAIISGIIFASHLGFTPEAKKILILHAWAGLATAIVGLITVGLWFRKSEIFYRSLLILTALLVLATGYFGGMLVWEM